MVTRYQRITMNFAPAKKRYETLDGRKYLVLPAVMITEGVHNGTYGPLYYSKPVIGKDCVAWNHKPVVVYHPTLNGEGISACDPNVVKKQGVGLLFNTDSDGRLKAETWIDEAKLKIVDPRVFRAVQNNEVMEVSTGMCCEIDETPGEWNGEKYIGSVTNIIPDHLAILPDQTGACSIADGAGLLRNTELSYDDLRSQIRTLLTEMHQKDDEGADGGSSLMEYGLSYYCYVCDIFQSFIVYEMEGSMYSIDYKVRDGKVSLSGEPSPVYRQVTYITANGESVRCKTMDRIRSALSTQRPDFGTIVDLTSTHVICNARDGVFRLPYTVEDDMIRFVGEPELEPEMTTAANKKVNNNTSTTPPPVLSPPRKEQVTKLIGGNLFVEGDRAWLEGLSDEDFGRFSKLGKGEPPEVPVLTVPEGVAALDKTQGVTQNAQKPVTVEEYLNNNSLPPQVRTFLQNSLHRQQQEKEHLIGIILNSKGNRFTKQWLESIDDINQLQGMASLCAGTGQPAVQNNGDAPRVLLDNSPFQQPSTAVEGRTLDAPKPVFNRDGSRTIK